MNDDLLVVRLALMKTLLSRALIDTFERVAELTVFLLRPLDEQKLQTMAAVCETIIVMVKSFELLSEAVNTVTWQSDNVP